jgi:hypothetical protein
MASFRNKISIHNNTSYEEYSLLDRHLFLSNVLKYNTKVTAIKSVFSLMALLMLATLITGATSFQTTLAQPIMRDSNRSMGYGSAGTNFNPMSFANNLFNASSLYGSVGISMVNGVKVTSISLLENNEIAVTLRHSAAANTTTSNNVNASTTMSIPPPRVTVTAIRAPMNLKDLMSLASQSSNNSTNNVNPLSFLTALQIGSSSTIVNAEI